MNIQTEWGVLILKIAIDGQVRSFCSVTQRPKNIYTGILIRRKRGIVLNLNDRNVNASTAQFASGWNFYVAFSGKSTGHQMNGAGGINRW